MRPPFYAVIDTAILRAREEGIYEEGDENLLALAATAFMHMAADAGRPSDAARTTCGRYLRNPSSFRADERAASYPGQPPHLRSA